MLKLIGFQLTLDWQFELIREKLKNIYGKDIAENMFNGKNLFDNTTIMDDEELQLMNLYEKYTPSSEKNTINEQKLTTK